MPTSNSQLKFTAGRSWNISARQHVQYQHGGKMPANNSCKQQQAADCFHRRANALFLPSFSNSSQRNVSDTSLMKTLEEDEYDVENSDTDDFNGLLHTSNLVTDPSSFQGNLRKSRVKPASKFLEEFLSRGSLEYERELESGTTESSEVMNVKTSRKDHKSAKQKTRLSCPEGIYSNVQKIYTPKQFNPHLKLAKSIRSDSHYSGVDGNVSQIKEPQLQDKVRSDLSISVAPYSQKSSVSKNHYISSQSNSPAAKYRNFKKTINSSKHVNSRRTLQEDDHRNLKKFTFTANRPEIISDNNDMTAYAQSTTSKPDNLTSNKNAPPLQKSRQSTYQQVPKAEVKTKRERTQSGNNLHLDKLTAKENKYELKRKQRREIYALNKVMTELENDRFIHFMQYSGSST